MIMIKKHKTDVLQSEKILKKVTKHEHEQDNKWAPLVAEEQFPVIHVFSWSYISFRR